ncbi:MAG: OmpA family protein [Saprospiraceae bacterium]|nr:OmpA family protein [Saprospiraceae bacterium]
MKTLKLFVVCLSFIVVSQTVSAQEVESSSQSQNRYDTWSLSLQGGTMQFYGDVSYNTFFPGSRKGSELSLCGHVGINKQITRYFAVQGQFLIGNLASEEKKQNEYFKSEVLNYNINIHVSTSNLLLPDKPNKWLNHYFIVGLGMTHYRTIRSSLDSGLYINSMGYKDDGLTKDKRVRESVANIGTGLKFKLSDRLDLVVETTIKSTPRDNMDALYVHLSELDKYGYLTIGVTFKFGNNKNSLEWDDKDDTQEIKEELAKTNDNMDSLNMLINNLNNNVAILMNQYNLENGPDADNDSVPDYRDVEPNTIEGSLVDAQGRAIPNCCDPDKPNYNPIARAAATGGGGGGLGVGNALYSVFFGLNSTYVTPLNHERIAIAANMLKRNPNMKYELIGSTCSLASNQYNIDLSKRRVDMIRDILVNEYGIDANRLIIKYEGEEKPLNITDKNKYVNRRVDIFVTK